MKSSVAVASLCATLAVAGPVKRAISTQWVYETVTVTVTGDDTAPTSTAAPTLTWGSWSAPADPTTTSAPAPAPTEDPSTWAVWTSVAPAAPSPPPSSGLSDYAAPILDQHNLHRANHSAPAMAWDDELASIAQQIAETCVYEHNTDMGGGGYGQNIGAGAPGSDAPKMITNDMYNGEVNHYPGYGGEPSMDDFENWGHFSQIIWASTTSVGCYTAYCPGGLANTGGNISPYFTVCNYKPAGNFAGQYGDNVRAPTGDASVVV